MFDEMKASSIRPMVGWGGVARSANEIDSGVLSMEEKESSEAEYEWVNRWCISVLGARVKSANWANGERSCVDAFNGQHSGCRRRVYAGVARGTGHQQKRLTSDEPTPMPPSIVISPK